MVWRETTKRRLIARSSLDGLTPLLAAGLLACGGGGGTSPPKPPPPTLPEPEPPEPEPTEPKPSNLAPTAFDFVSEAFHGTFPVTNQPFSIDYFKHEKSGEPWVLVRDEGQKEAVHLATLTLTDDALGDNQLRLSDDTHFELRATANRLVWQLWQKDGVIFDHETAPRDALSVSVVGHPSLSQNLVVTVGDIDEPPHGVVLSSASVTIAEGVVGTARKLTDISFLDQDAADKFNPNIARPFANHPLFELRNKNTELWLKKGAVLDYETARSHEFEIFANLNIPQVTHFLVHREYSLASAIFTLNVTDVDEPPTDMEVTVEIDTVDEGFQREIRIAHVVFTDDDENENDDYGFANHIYFGDNEVTIAGDSIFEIVNRSQLWLKPEIVLDYEKQTRHTVTLIGPNGLTKDVTLNLRDIVEPPVSIHSHQFILNRAPVETFFEKDGDVYQYTRGEGIYVERALATIIFNAEALNGHPPEIDDDRFIELRATDEPLIWQLWQKPGIDFDFETKPNMFDFTLTAGDDDTLTRTFRIAIRDTDERPTAVLLSQNSIELTEGVQTAQLLAHVTFEDPDAPGTNLGENGANIVRNDVFEMRNRNTELWLKEGAVLDYETMQEHVVTITALPLAAERFLRAFILGEDNPQFTGLPTIDFTLTVLDDPSDNPPLEII